MRCSCSSGFVCAARLKRDRQFELSDSSSCEGLERGRVEVNESIACLMLGVVGARYFVNDCAICARCLFDDGFVIGRDWN